MKTVDMDTCHPRLYLSTAVGRRQGGPCAVFWITAQDLCGNCLCVSKHAAVPDDQSNTVNPPNTCIRAHPCLYSLNKLCVWRRGEYRGKLYPSHRSARYGKTQVRNKIIIWRLCKEPTKFVLQTWPNISVALFTTLNQFAHKIRLIPLRVIENFRR
jgi:hypothetical protein